MRTYILIRAVSGGIAAAWGAFHAGWATVAAWTFLGISFGSALSLPWLGFYALVGMLVSGFFAWLACHLRRRYYIRKMNEYLSETP